MAWTAFYNAVCNVLVSRRLPMALQNMAFWRVKRGLLQGERQLIGMHFVAFYKVGQVIFTDKVLFDFKPYIRQQPL